MKLLNKIFLCFVIIFGITFHTVGYLLINFAYSNSIEQEKQIAFQNFQYNRYILQSILYTDSNFFSNDEVELTDISKSFTVPIAVCGTDGEYIFSNMSAFPERLEFDEGEDDRINFQVCKNGEKSYIYVCDYVSQGEKGMYLVTQSDITSMTDMQKSMIDYFQRIYMVLLSISFPVIFLLTKAITDSIKKVAEVAGRMAKGKYSERISMKGKDEISELAFSFNQMAEQVEKKIIELSGVAKQKEEFAANFAHELKTPLTSVIGYADMLYQRNLPREEVKIAARYILDEGTRLESLSLKLMDLFVLDKQDFLMEKMSVREMFQNMAQGIEPICKKHGVTLHIDIGEGCIGADYDLFKTMILNLADNAIKADCKDLWVIGKQNNNCYQIKIKDNGKGIPSEEIGRITEAFYMVDKSRSRKQHGAGLGMALVSKIVEIHKAKMKIESDRKSGTVVNLMFHLEEGYEDE